MTGKRGIAETIADRTQATLLRIQQAKAECSARQDGLIAMLGRTQAGYEDPKDVQFWFEKLRTEQEHHVTILAELTELLTAVVVAVTELAVEMDGAPEPVTGTK